MITNEWKKTLASSLPHEELADFLNRVVFDELIFWSWLWKPKSMFNYIDFKNGGIFSILVCEAPGCDSFQNERRNRLL